MSYEIQNIAYSDNYFVHNRYMGTKSPGTHMYPNVPWSDVVLQHVPIEVPLRLTHQDYLIGESRNTHETSDIKTKATIVGDRHVDMNIRVAENTLGWMPPDDYKISKTHLRFPVKPRNKEKEKRNKYFKFQ